VVLAAFTKRRKPLRNALAGIADVDVMERAGIDAEARAQNLSVADYRRLAAAILESESG
jgi:16S rRNA (adenine1518-N6/adenine1519-N6)-dimethyltransferase